MGAYQPDDDTGDNRCDENSIVAPISTSVDSIAFSIFFRLLQSELSIKKEWQDSSPLVKLLVESPIQAGLV